METKLRSTGILEPTDECEHSEDRISGAIKRKDDSREFEYVWRSVIIITTLHLGALYGFWLILSGQTKLVTVMFGNNLF